MHTPIAKACQSACPSLIWLRVIFFRLAYSLCISRIEITKFEMHTRNILHNTIIEHFFYFTIRSPGGEMRKQCAKHMKQHLNVCLCHVKILRTFNSDPCCNVVKFEMSHKTTWQCSPLTTCITHHLCAIYQIDEKMKKKIKWIHNCC